MSSPNPLEQRPVLTWIVNFYTRRGCLPADQEQTLGHLIEAVAASRSAQPQVLVRVAPADLDPIGRRLEGLSGFRIELLGPDSHQRRLPLLRDILTPAPLAQGSALPPYVIYANADICIPPWFFDFLAQQVSQAQVGQASRFRPGWIPPDALIINRRDLLPSQADAPGGDRLAVHNGYDLFLFPQALLPQLVLGEVCVGLPPVGALLALNLLLLCRRVALIDDLFLSWHHGSDRDWLRPEHQAATATNTEAAARAFRQLSGHNPAVLQQLPFLGFERRLAQLSYQGLAERLTRATPAPPG